MFVRLYLQLFLGWFMYCLFVFTSSCLQEGSCIVCSSLPLCVCRRAHVLFGSSLPLRVCRRAHVLFGSSLPLGVCRRAHVLFGSSLPLGVC